MAREGMILGLSMTDWSTLPAGATEEVTNNGAEVQVHHPKDGVFVIHRFFDGARQDTASVRQIGIGMGSLTRARCAWGTRR
jgi:hypothetical protein